MSSESSYPVSPPQHRCVWMRAGVLAYQLCDRDFECTDCPLDRAMRNMHLGSPDGEAVSLPYMLRPLRPGRYYTQEHCWISVRSAESIRIGLEPNLAARCEGLVAISLPGTRYRIAARIPAAWCRFEKGMIPVRLPFQCRVEGVNDQLSGHPALMVKDPYDAGWLFDAKVEPHCLEENRVMTAWVAEKIYASDELRYRSAVRDRGGTMPKEIGETAYDGGEASLDVLRHLGSTEYCSLISSLYCKAS